MSHAAGKPRQPGALTLQVIAVLAAAALAIVVYFPTRDLGFVDWDDPDYVTTNLDLHAPNEQFARWAATAWVHGNWHPVTWWSLRFDLLRGGGAPGPFHTTATLVHAVNSAMVVIVTMAFAAAAGGSTDRFQIFAAAALGCVFAVHPLHVESVAWIAERKDVLYAFFWLMSLLCFLKYAGSRQRQGRWYTGSLLSFFASLASKPMAVTLVPILFLCDLWPLRRLRRTGWSKILLEKLPFLLAAAGIALLTLAKQRDAGAMASLDQIPLLYRLFGAVFNLGFYLTKSLVPLQLSPLYPIHGRAFEITIEQAIGFSLFSSWCLAGWRWRARWPVVGFSALGFALSLLPILGVFQAGNQQAADRYAYLAVAFPVAVIVQGAVALTGRAPQVRPLVLAALVFALVGLSLGTTKQLRYWRDSPSLWARVLALAPGNPIAHYNLGEHFRSVGDLATAVRHWQAVLDANPQHSWALNQLANVALIEGKLKTAETLYRKAVEADSANVEALYNLVLTLDRQGRLAEADPYMDAFLDNAGPELAEQASWVRGRRSALRPAPSTPSFSADDPR